MVDHFTINTPVGRLTIDIDSDLVNSIQLNSGFELSSAKSLLGEKVVKQIRQYFKSPEFKFDLPLLQRGTEHQLKVWEALSEIPSGTVLTYGKLAKKIGSSARAIGNACRNNPLPIVVPCHRIVAACDIGGFSGSQSGVLLDIKRDLLHHEGIVY